jgi:GNAT superfamily N-acetyltransferase
MENTSIGMTRPNFENIPTFELPKSYTLRTYQPGDEKAWREIHMQADPFNTFDEKSFVKGFGQDEQLWRENQFYICDESNQPVGTATAWSVQKEQHPTPQGLVHWVALYPHAQGKGLSKPLMSAVCHRLRDRNFECAYLNTSSGRLPAVALYLAFGFIPNIRKPEELAAWSDVKKQLGPRAIGLEDF